MELIQANSCILQVRLNDAYVSVLCAKSFSPDFVAKIKETTTEGDGTYQDFDYDTKSFSILLESVLVIQDATNPTTLDLLDYHRNMVEVDFRLLFFGTSGSVKVIRGKAIVESCNLSASAGLLAEGSVKLTGKGEYIVEDALPEFVNLRILSTGNDLAEAFIKVWLINANGEAVFQTDVLPQANGGQLSNPVDITVQVPKGQWYYWFQVVSNIVGNNFALDAPPTKSTNFNNGTFNEGSYGVQLYDFTANRQITITLGINNPPPACVAPGITSDLNNPSGTVGTPWLGTVVLSGSTPFTITNVIKPAWMDISIVDNVITLQGNPEAGINQPISFDINNACGTLHFADTIDISSNPDSVLLNYNYDEDATFGGAAGAFRIYVNATLVQFFATDGSSNYICNPGDTVEVQVVGVNGIRKHIDVQDSVAGQIYNANVTTITHTYTFVTVLGHNYTINAESGNP